MKQRVLQVQWLAVLSMVLSAIFLGCVNGGRAPAHADGFDDHPHEEEAPNELLEQAIASASLLITHIHGMGYSSDGSRLLLAAHDGLKAYEAGEWTTVDAPHDFMGFTAVSGGFFSSGHPAAGSGLPNPLGLVFVEDRSWEVADLGFQGNLDFHLMAAGYASRTIYLVNTEKSTTLPTGLFVSNDGGENWDQRPGTGLNGTLRQIAVHPTDPLVSAYATSGGLYVSVDSGVSANLWIDRTDGHAVAFSPDGDRVYFGGTDLEFRDLAGSGRELGRTELEGTITQIAVNPLDLGELTVATDKMSVVRSDDGGNTWQPILFNGRDP